MNLRCFPLGQFFEGGYNWGVAGEMVLDAVAVIAVKDERAAVEADIAVEAELAGSVETADAEVVHIVIDRIEAAGAFGNQGQWAKHLEPLQMEPEANPCHSLGEVMGFLAY